MSTMTPVTNHEHASDRRPTGLVDPDWLTAHISDPGVRVVEVDVSPRSYDNWHIEGAVLWNVYSDLKDDTYRLVDRTGMEALLARSGIGPDSLVVFYGYAPAMGLWLLQHYGHGRSAILDCSRDAWRSEGRPCATDRVVPTSSVCRLGAEASAVRATRAEVRDAIGHRSTTLLDVRSAAEYCGDTFWPSGAMEPGGQTGHVPGARHQPVDDLYDQRGAFRSTDELRLRFGSVDLDGTDELITYCTIGGRAATAWFVLTHLLGRANVRVYDGSWAEWGLLPGAPVER
jgi:thiosulfate/3-mercaptopyruvate sulfurtransferase